MQLTPMDHMAYRNSTSASNLVLPLFDRTIRIEGYHYPTSSSAALLGMTAFTTNLLASTVTRAFATSCMFMLFSGTCNQFELLL